MNTCMMYDEHLYDVWWTPVWCMKNTCMMYDEHLYDEHLYDVWRTHVWAFRQEYGVINWH